MAEQVALLKAAAKKLVTAFISSRHLPEPVTDEFVRAISQVLTRFEVRRVASKDIWTALFPEATPATLDELTSRFRDLLERLSAGASADRIDSSNSQIPTTLLGPAGRPGDRCHS